MLNKGELVQSGGANFFGGRMAFLLPASRIHSLDLIHSLTTKTPKQGKGITPLTLAL